MCQIEQDWITRAGLRAVVLISRRRCGYVAVGREHPLYHRDYSDRCPCLRELAKKAEAGPIGKRGMIPLFSAAAQTEGEELLPPTPECVFDVHGSITYSDGNEDYPAKCHNEEWWFGFDCGHVDDDEPGGRSLEYCIAECESLARQLARVSTPAG